MLDRSSALQHVIEYKGDFGTWAVNNADMLFLPRRENGYSLNAIIHLFMKRLGQSYETILRMPEDDRDELFDTELKLIEKEATEASSTNSRKPKGK